MKKGILWLCALAVALCPVAYAEENLGGIACIGEERIAYSGSVDGEILGVFLLSTAEGAQRIYDRDAMLLAQSANAVLVMDNFRNMAALLDENGAILAEVAGSFTGATADGGTFYVGNWAISEDGARQQTLFEASVEEMSYLLPLKVLDGYCYFLDARAYGPMVFGDSALAAAALCRVPVAGGTIETISGPGTRVIGWFDDGVVYERRNFWYDSEEIATEMPVTEGIYAQSTNDGMETLIAALPPLSEEAYSYTLVEQGTIYGVQRKSDGTAVLKRLTVRGETLPDIAIPDAVLCDASSNWLLLAQNAYEQTENGLRQQDKILLMDLASGAVQTLNAQREDVLFFTDGAPLLCLQGDSVFWIGYNTTLSSIELYCADRSSGVIHLLAKGYSWATEEEAVG